MFLKPILFALLTTPMVYAAPAGFGREDGARLLESFVGFTPSGMATVFELFKAETQGRLLLDKAARKIGVANRDEWLSVFCFCRSDQLASYPERRGLFIQEKARFYRERGTEEWHAGTRGGSEKLFDAVRFPIVTRRTWDTRNFQHLEVAFKPVICVKQGLSVLQTYLVLVHELTHLADSDPFAVLDLHAFDNSEKEKRFYFAQLSIPGGELDAHLAQLQAYSELKKRFGYKGDSVLQPYLDGKGRLLIREREAFLLHLLDQANYRAELDRYLTDQVVYQYNTAYAWWEYLQRMMVGIEERLGELERDSGIVSKAMAEAETAKLNGEVRRLTGLNAEIETLLKQKRAQLKALGLEQAEYAAVMDRIDADYPREK